MNFSNSSFDATAKPKRSALLSGLLRIALFFSILIGIIYSLDWIVDSGLRKKRSSKFGAMNDWTRGSLDSKVIINGSSRALVHYDPRTLEAKTGLTAYNLGMNGIQIDIQLSILKAYLEANASPLIVIQNLESFSFETTKERKIYDPGLYIPYLNNRELFNGLNAIDPAVWKWKHIPLYGYVKEDVRFTWIWGILAHLGYDGPNDYFRGFNPRYLDWNEDFEAFRRSTPNGVTYAIEEKGVSSLLEIVSICKKRGIELILVFSPEYHEVQKLQVNRREIFERFQSIADSSKVAFWDFSSSPIAKDSRNFYNSQHLNASGAAQFSEEVAELLKAHLVAKGILTP